MKKLKLSLLILVGSLVPTLQAAESDNFIAYQLELVEQADELNILVNKRFQKAVLRSNAKAEGCDEDSLYKYLRKDFNNHLLGQLIKDILNKKELQTHITPLKSSIYKDWSLFDGFLLGRKAAIKNHLTLSPLLKVDNVVIGVDKLEHMFGNGFRYFKQHHKKGKDIESVLRKGIFSERVILGGNAFTTGVFSYGDLSANFNGMRFWNHVIQKHPDILGARYSVGPYVKCQKNKWVLDTPVDMRNYIDLTMDESINCSKTATKNAAKKILNIIKDFNFIGSDTCIHSMDKLKEAIPKYSHNNIYKLLFNFDGIEQVSKLDEF